MVSPRRDALMGFELGTTFDSHQARLHHLHLHDGYDAAPAALDASGRISLIKRDSQGWERGALVLSYSAEGLLDDVRLLMAGDDIVDAASAEVAATKLRDEHVGAIGAPTCVVDDIHSWAHDGGYQDTGASGFSAFWSAAAGGPSRAASAGDYLERLRKAVGPVLSMSISTAAGEGKVLASVLIQLRR